MAATATGERRRCERYEREVPLLVFDQRRKAIDAEPETVDISLRGLGLRTASALKPGDGISFRLMTPQGPVTGEARIRWVRPHRLGYQCGAEIAGLRWIQRRRLRLYLDPEAFDVVRVFDRLATVAAVVVVYLALVEFLGLPMNPFAGG